MRELVAASQIEGMKSLIVAALAAQTLLSGPPIEDQFRWARDAFDRQMIDYPSARFRDVHADRRRICGYVNGKNRLGAYSGWKRFVVMGIEDAEAQIEGDEDFPGAISMMCDEDPIPHDQDYSGRLRHRPS